MEKEQLSTYRMAWLLAKAKTGALSEEEARELDGWRTADEENERFFNALMNDEGLREDWLRFRQVDRRRGLAQMQLRTRRTQRIATWRGVAAGAAILLLAAGGWLAWNEKPQEEKDATQMARVTQVVPAKPILRTEDERIIVIDSISRLEEAGAVISRDSAGQLVYSQRTEAKAQGSRHTLEIPRGAEFFLTLEDGTHVWLNAGTRLSYPAVFGREERRVCLEGEAYFDVRHEEGRPFRVETGGETIEVLGTEFNVNAYTGERKYTTLVEGRVKVTSEGGEEVILHPGEQRISDGKDWSVRRVDTEEVTSWREGMFVLEDRTLEEIMAQLERWYNFSVFYRNEELKHITFKGKIPRYTSFEDILNVLEKTGDIRFEIQGKAVTVHSN